MKIMLEKFRSICIYFDIYFCFIPQKSSETAVAQLCVSNWIEFKCQKYTGLEN